MAESQQSQGSGAQVSEAQIAVHWREEESYYPPPAFVEQANAADPAIFERFSEEHFPELLQGVRGPAHLGCPLAHDAGHQQRAVLEVVRRRQAECLVQLRGPACGGQPGQDGDHLRARAGIRRPRRDQLLGAAIVR